MGLFNIFKSKEKDNMHEIMQGIHKEIFPGGHEQVEQEVQDVRALLNFRYTREEIKGTYFYAAAIFYMDKSKQQESIVSSILSNRQSAVTREDAIKLFEYLKRKFGVTPIQSVASEILGGMSKVNTMFMIAKGGIVELKNGYKDMSNEGKFEVILINSSLIFRTIKQSTPDIYPRFHQEYVSLLVSTANSYNIDIPIKQLMELMQSRISLYVNEVHSLMMTDGYKAYKSFNAIYYKPLLLNTINVNYSSEIDYKEFEMALLKMIKWVMDKIKRIS